LWVSQGIVQKHQGKLRLRSSTDREKHGTCCTVFLPYVTSAVKPQVEDQPIPSEPVTDIAVKSVGSGDDRSAA
jgi:hypothetical protein